MRKHIILFLAGLLEVNFSTNFSLYSEGYIRTEFEVPGPFVSLDIVINCKNIVLALSFLVQVAEHIHFLV